MKAHVPVGGKTAARVASGTGEYDKVKKKKKDVIRSCRCLNAGIERKKIGLHCLSKWETAVCSCMQVLCRAASTFSK